MKSQTWTPLCFWTLNKVGELRVILPSRKREGLWTDTPFLQEPGKGHDLSVAYGRCCSVDLSTMRAGKRKRCHAETNASHKS